MMRDKYTAKEPKDPLVMTPEMADVVHRRVMPFLRNGTHYSIEHLMTEAYLQGLRDAIQVEESR